MLAASSRMRYTTDTGGGRPPPPPPRPAVTITLPSSIAALPREERANLGIQHAINTLTRQGDAAGAKALHFRWYACGRFDQTWALFVDLYGLAG